VVPAKIAVVDETVPVANTRVRMEFVVLAGPTVVMNFSLA
jgi:hypothetical protein